MSWREYENTDTNTLIDYIRWKNEDGYEQIAEDAFRAFCFRFRIDIISKCRVICKKWGYDNQISDLIAERTFNRFWKYPKGWKAEKCKYEVDLCVKLYLYGITQTQLADYRKEESGENASPYNGEEEIVYELPDLEHISGTVEEKRKLKQYYDIVEKALDKLSPKHKIIYLTYKMYGEKEHKMPRHLLKSLREELNLAQASLQVYKKEATDTVNQYLEIYGSKK